MKLQTEEYVTLKDARIISMSKGLKRSQIWWKIMSKSLPMESFFGRKLIKREKLMKFIKEHRREK